ncbi:MAG: hypothetical protein HYV27_07705 [Candidatus Hydrogenedentes bacterium]|nr:hypothetical protein [Candidatus Hydrogenedentota bacterium]
MVRALYRWFKAVGYLMTGQLDSARRTLDSNPHVMAAKYDDVIREKTARIHQYKQAVAGLIAQQEGKLQKIKALTDEVGRLEDLKAGALAKAKKRVEELKAAGKPLEAIHTDEDYLRCQTAFKDFSGTLAEKQARIDELEEHIGEYSKRVAEHKVQLQSLMREIDQIKAEKTDAVADVITAREEKEVADTLAGIAKDGAAEELQRMRQLRNELKAEARVSKELAGTDSRAQEADFLEYARKDQSKNEFDALIGLAAEADGVKTSVPQEKPESALPE